MNITTFNDAFERPFIAGEGQARWNLIKNSPLFVHGMEYKKSIQKFTDEDATGRETHVPYTLFRLSMTLVQEQTSLKSEEHFLVDSTKALFSIYHYVAKHSAHVHGPAGRADVIFRFTFGEDFSGIDYGDQEFWIIGENRWMSLREYVWRLRDKIGRVPNPPSKDPVTLVRDMSLASIALLGAFSMDVMAPTNHIVQVRPDQPGRSVQWLEQRTHYTLIHHGHPANTKGLTEGQDVTVDQKAELSRMAHSRRAHKRTLRAARFTYARGKTIDVKSAWIGPKEWKEKGSRQIYKILEPVVS